MKDSRGRWLRGGAGVGTVTTLGQSSHPFIQQRRKVISSIISMTWNTLIRTQHITSLKKIAKLRAAASRHDCAVLIKYGSPPGIMYCEGDKEEDVR